MIYVIKHSGGYRAKIKFETRGGLFMKMIYFLEKVLAKMIYGYILKFIFLDIDAVYKVK